MRTLRVISFICSLTLLLGVLTGCGNKEKEDMQETNSPSFEELLAMDWNQIEEIAKTEGEVTFSVWYYESQYIELMKSFTDKYGIKVNTVIADQEATAQKALAEKEGKTGTVDVAVIAESIKTMLDAKLLAGPILEKIENSDQLDPALSQSKEGVPHGGYVVPYYLSQTCFLYNSDHLKESELPQTWAELEKYIDEHPRKFGICVPEKGGTGQAFTMLAIQELTGGLEKYYGDDTVDESKTADWDKVWKWFQDRKDKITLTTSNSDSISRLNQGELDIVVAWPEDAAAARNAGELGSQNLTYIPQMGLAGGGDTLGIFSNAKHKAAALLLVNWMVSSEGQEKMAELMNMVPARLDVEFDTGLSNEDKARRTEWVPIAYKTKFTHDFTTNVLR